MATFVGRAMMNPGANGMSPGWAGRGFARKVDKLPEKSMIRPFNHVNG